MKARQILLLIPILIGVRAAANPVVDSLVVKTTNGQRSKIAISNIRIVVFDSMLSAVRERPDPRNVSAGVAALTVFPDPVTQTCRIAFHAEQAGSAEISVSNGKGAVLFTQRGFICQPGDNLWDWNCRSQSGERISSGTYNCHVSLGQHSMTEQFIVIK